MNQEIVILVETRDMEDQLVGQKEIARITGTFPQTLLTAILGNEAPRNPVYKLRPAPANTSAPESNGSPMTENQRRYLFRLLSQKGIEGEQARKHLLQEFGVENLKQADKGQASSLIDRLLQKEVGRGAD